MKRTVAHWLIWSFIGLTFVFGVITLIVDYQATADWAERGSRGDFWSGHVATIASATSALLLVITLMLQMDELRLQRIDSAETRTEIRDSRLVAEKQCEVMELQKETARVALVSSVAIQALHMRTEMYFSSKMVSHSSNEVYREQQRRIEQSTQPIVKWAMSELTEMGEEKLAKAIEISTGFRP